MSTVITSVKAALNDEGSLSEIIATGCALVALAVNFAYFFG